MKDNLLESSQINSEILDEKLSKSDRNRKTNKKVSFFPVRTLEATDEKEIKPSIVEIGTEKSSQKKFQRKLLRQPSANFQLDRDALQNYKKSLQKRVAWTFIILFFVILERIFAEYTRQWENGVITELQSNLGINQENYAPFYLDIGTIYQNPPYMIMFLAHFYVFMYYYIDPIVTYKIMIAHVNSGFIIGLMEIIFGEARPFWDDSSIIGVSCPRSYEFPNFTNFSILFLFLYTRKCINDQNEIEGKPNKCGIFLTIGLLSFYLLICFLQYSAGIDYLVSLFMTAVYAAIFYQVSVFFDRSINDLAERSTADFVANKRASIYWMVYIIIAGALATFTYETSSTFLDIKYFENLFMCLKISGNTQLLNTTPYYRLIGSWISLIQTTVIFLLLGATFGCSMTFRHTKGVLWYKTTRRNRINMTAVATLCLIPSWIITLFQPDFVNQLDGMGVDMYLFDAIHFSLLFYLVMGVLVTKIFEKLGWTNRDESEKYDPEEDEIMIDHMKNIGLTS